MKDYHYHYDDADKDSRGPACYLLTYRGCRIILLTYRGCRYWSCYRIHLVEWFEKMFKTEGS
jgi:hypothetical protein